MFFRFAKLCFGDFQHKILRTPLSRLFRILYQKDTYRQLQDNLHGQRFGLIHFELCLQRHKHMVLSNLIVLMLHWCFDNCGVLVNLTIAPMPGDLCWIDWTSLPLFRAKGSSNVQSWTVKTCVLGGDNSVGQLCSMVRENLIVFIK